MNLNALPAFTENHIWMLHDGVDAIVAGPGDSAPVTGALVSQRLVTTILVTHRHPQHIRTQDSHPMLRRAIILNALRHGEPAAVDT